MSRNEVLLPPKQRRNSAAVRQALALASGLAGSATLAYRSMMNPSNARLVDRVIRAAHEQKNIDVTSTTAIPNTNVGTLVLLNATTQGTTGSSRTGRRFKMERLQIDGLYLSQSALSYEDVLRVVVVYDKEPRGGAFTTTDLFENNTFGTIQCTSPLRFDNLDRFQVLADRLLIWATPTTVTAPAGLRVYARFHLDIGLGQVVKCYNTSAGTVADIDEGSLYLVQVTNQTANVPDVTVNTRVTFRDL